MKSSISQASRASVGGTRRVKGSKAAAKKKASVKKASVGGTRSTKTPKAAGKRNASAKRKAPVANPSADNSRKS